MLDLSKKSINMLQHHVTSHAVCLTENDSVHREFILDSGAQCHSSGDRRWFSTLSSEQHQLEFPNGTSAAAQGGTLKIRTETVIFVLDGATYCPGLRRNLLSMVALLKTGFQVVQYNADAVVLHHSGGNIELVFRARDGLYRIAVDHAVCMINAVLDRTPPNARRKRRRR